MLNNFTSSPRDLITDGQVDRHTLTPSSHIL